MNITRNVIRHRFENTATLYSHLYSPNFRIRNSKKTVEVIQLYKACGEDDEMFMTRSLNVTPKTTEQRI